MATCSVTAQTVRAWSSGAAAFLADPFGRIVAKASHESEEILIGEIDVALLEETRRNWPFLRDRRIDAYAPITQRFLDATNAWSADGDPK